MQRLCSCSSGVEHTLGKGEVDGSNPSMSSTLERRAKARLFSFRQRLTGRGCQAVFYPLTWRPLLETACKGRSQDRYRPVAQLAEQRSPRSEEHTSELQSRPHLVCRLLLEKKKKTK